MEKRRVISSFIWKYIEKMGAVLIDFVIQIILAILLLSEKRIKQSCAKVSGNLAQGIGLVLRRHVRTLTDRGTSDCLKTKIIAWRIEYLNNHPDSWSNNWS